MPARQSYTQYTVVKGDTLAAIAKRFNTTVAAIAATSGIADPNKIKVGQVLSVATGTYDPDDLELAEVQVTAKRLPVPVSYTGDPVVNAVNAAGEWLRPPKLWITLAVAAGLGYYLLADDIKARKRK